jgi:hypothetical protein
MLNDSLTALAIAIFVISSVAWVSQWRRIRNRMKIGKALRAERDAPANAPEWPL